MWTSGGRRDCPKMIDNEKWVKLGWHWFIVTQEEEVEGRGFAVVSPYFRINYLSCWRVFLNVLLIQLGLCPLSLASLPVAFLLPQ